MRLWRPSSVREWVVLGYGLVGIGLLPWAVWLSSSLPATHHSAHWDLAWSGFDVGLAVCFCGTAISAYRRSPWVGPFAAATGTLLLTDAWFDVVLESHGNEEMTAVFEAVVFELPAAALCYWIAYRTEHFIVRALHFAAARQSAPERDLIGVLEVAAHGEAAGESRDADASA